MLCGDHVCACSNGMDDDGDGDVDGFDPECTGPMDDDESSFATGIPGDNRGAAFQDCFFDGDSGGGNDGCRLPTGCLTGEIDPTDARCEVSERCRTFCLPGTTNGCDCFGCCEVRLRDGTTTTILTGADCDLDDIDSCTTCTQVASCLNTCERCELCPGKGPEDLPEDCSPPPPDAGTPSDGGSPADGGGPGWSCDGTSPCSFDSDCAPGQYCSLGCCLSILM